MASKSQDDDQRIKEIRERESKATPGPWSIEENAGAWNEEHDEPAYHVPEMHDLNGSEFDVPSMGNALFVAHARSDIPWLLERVEALTVERDAHSEAGAEAATERNQWREKAERLAEFIEDLDGCYNPEFTNVPEFQDVWEITARILQAKGER